MAAPEPSPFLLEAGGPALAGELLGEGPAVVLAHGITATRRYVVHGSKALARAGFTQVSYDARGHGESAPAPADGGYSYTELAGDMGRVIEERAADGAPVLCGDSMGCHTAVTYALAHADRLAGVVLIRPATLGLPPDEESLAHWDRLADGLERDGAEGFMEVYEREPGGAEEFRDTILRFTGERIRLHRDPRALARAVREVPRSLPFEGMVELESLDLPALVVASRDEADPGHPRSIAEAWTESLPRASLIGEGAGESPLAWQGGKLSREIAAFCERPEVAERHRA